MATGRLRTNCRAERMACLVCPGRHRRYDCIPNDLGIGRADSPAINEYILTPRQPYSPSRNWTGVVTTMTEIPLSILRFILAFLQTSTLTVLSGSISVASVGRPCAFSNPYHLGVIILSPTMTP
jgi:hypothetical protein